MPLSILQPNPAPSIPTPPKTLGLYERWLWISPFNVTRELTAFVNGTQVIRGMTGRYAPPVLAVRDVIPGIPGQRMREIHHDMRELDLPLFALADDRVAFQALLSQMVRDFDPVAGSGTLRHIAIDGTTSDLFCRCVGGLGIDSEGSMGPHAATPTLVFQADDPYWYGDIIQQSFSGGAPVNWFAMLPVQLGSASVLGDTTIDNVGDVKAWPIWTIQGPGSNPTLTNQRTNEVVSLAASLGAGDRVIIDTRPGYKTVRGPNGLNYRRYLTDYALWGLLAGKNSVTLSMSGATSASYITLAYRPAYLVPGGPAVTRGDAINSPPSPVSTSGIYSDVYSDGY